MIIWVQLPLIISFATRVFTPPFPHMLSSPFFTTNATISSSIIVFLSSFTRWFALWRSKKPNANYLLATLEPEEEEDLPLFFHLPSLMCFFLRLSLESSEEDLTTFFVSSPCRSFLDLSLLEEEEYSLLFFLSTYYSLFYFWSGTTTFYELVKEFILL